MMNNFFRIRAFSLASAVVMASYLPSAHAETKAIEIRPGDSLSRIVATQYQGYSNNAAIMQFILEQNPNAFIDNDVNRLVIGKVLVLPDAASIPAAGPNTLAPPTPSATPAAASAPTPTPTTDITEAGGDQQKLQELDQALQALQTERSQLNARLTQLEQENTELKANLTAQPAITEPTVDTATVERLQEAEKERDALRTRLQQLEADKTRLETQQGTLTSDKQQLGEQINALETKVAALTADKEAVLAAARHSISATGDGTEPSRAEMDMAALNQQLDLIASANVQLQGEKDALQKERDELNTRLNELTATKEAVTASTSTKSDTPTETAGIEQEPNQAQMDLEILNQQLDAIESANVQLQSEKDALQKELDTTKQQLSTSEAPTKEAATSSNVSTDTGTDTKTTPANAKLEQELQQELEKTQQDLKLANAAKANAELTRANLEKNGSGGSLWPWLLALLLAPLAWFLGRSTVRPVPQTPPTVQAVPTTPASTITAVAPALDPEENPTPEGETTPVTDITTDRAPPSPAYPVAAANDDNPDAAIKLDMVRAYLDLRDSESAQPILNEVLREGGRQQRQEAREILSFLS